MSIVAAAYIALATPLAQGCFAEAGLDPGSDGEVGQVVLPLLQPGTHGELFHLANATFDITAAGGVVFSVDGSSNDNSITLQLPPGLASVTLRDGWTLQRSTDNGSTYQPVSALLGSLNPAGLRVLANQPVIVQFSFLVRDTNGTLRVTLGVDANPRELAGGVVISTATDGFAGYLTPGNTTMDFAMYFQLAKLQSVTLPDGTKQHIYTAGTQSGVPGPNPPIDTPLAAEFYNDHLGIMSSTIGPDFQAGFLTYTVSAKPDGTFTLSGEIDGLTTSIVFEESAIDAVSSPTVDADGFPNDMFFYDSGVPFTLNSTIGTMSGTLRMRHLVPSN